MPVLFKADGSPLKDAAGNHLKTGQTVIDQRYLAKASSVRPSLLNKESTGLIERVNDWLGQNKAAGKPKSRGAEHLTAKFVSGGADVTVRTHTGASVSCVCAYVILLPTAGSPGRSQSGLRNRPMIGLQC